MDDDAHPALTGFDRELGAELFTEPIHSFIIVRCLEPLRDVESNCHFVFINSPVNGFIWHPSEMVPTRYLVSSLLIEVVPCRQFEDC